MDLRIWMKGEELNRTIPRWNVMFMPGDATNRYFIVEIREVDSEKLRQIKELIPMVERGFCSAGEFILKTTRFGFMLKKKVDEDVEYLEAWEKWVKFSQALFTELAMAIGEEVPDFTEY